MKQYNTVIEIVNLCLNRNDLILEQKLDIIFYKLYELTHNEILIIDPKFNLSVEEYDAFIVE